MGKGARPRPGFPPVEMTFYCRPGDVEGGEETQAVSKQRPFHTLRDYVTTAEAAQILGMTASHVRYLIERGKLVGVGVVETPLGRLLHCGDIERLRQDRAARPRGRGRPSRGMSRAQSGG